VIATTFKKVLIFTLLGQKIMGKPADRVKGVSLVTDYGVLDQIAKKQEAEKAKMHKKVPDYTEYWEGA